MTTKPTPEQTAADERARVQEMVTRAVQGDASVLPELRRVLNGHPEMWRAYGDLAAHAQASMIHRAAGKDLLLQESLERKAGELRAEVAGDSPSALERLLAERVIATWLQVYTADAVAAQMHGEKVTLTVLREMQKRQESAQRSHLAAIKQLATVRRLLKPALSPFDILSRPAPEVAVGRTAFKVRRAESVAAGVPVEN
jgi:hypothetical protein